jgi:TDG/mug DNA glycosylase family protein
LSLHRRKHTRYDPAVDAARHPPTPAEIRAAAGRRIPDVIAPGLRVLFCGINPGLYSGAVGHHFARPGNRFWKALHGSGFTDRVLSPFDDATLVARGLGITNLCPRTTARAEELTPAELKAGARTLATKVRRYRPRVLAILGVGAFRAAFSRPAAVLGRQPEELEGAAVWVLPNPSGLNAHYALAALVHQFQGLRDGMRRHASALPPARGGGRVRPHPRTRAR